MEMVTIIAATAGQQKECAPFIQEEKSRMTVNHHVAIATTNTYNICIDNIGE